MDPTTNSPRSGGRPRGPYASLRGRALSFFGAAEWITETVMTSSARFVVVCAAVAGAAISALVAASMSHVVALGVGGAALVAEARRPTEAPRRIVLGAAGPELVHGVVSLSSAMIYELRSDLEVDGELRILVEARGDDPHGKRFVVQ